jgi:hypothetical protein
MLVEPIQDAGAPCLMRGTIPPGVFVPLRSHLDPETFIQLSGCLEGLSETRDGFRWLPIAPGEVFHVPGEAKHAFRNRSEAAAVGIVVTTPRLGRFFREVGTGHCRAATASSVGPGHPAFSGHRSARQSLEWHGRGQRGGWTGASAAVAPADHSVCLAPCPVDGACGRQ